MSKVVQCDASLKECKCHNEAMEKIEEDKMKWTTMSNELDFQNDSLKDIQQDEG